MDQNEIATLTYQHAVEVDGLSPVLAMKKALAAIDVTAKDQRIEDLQGEVAELKLRNQRVFAALRGEHAEQGRAVA